MTFTIVKAILYLAFITGGLFVALCQIYPETWITDLFNNFRQQYIVTFICMGIISFLLKDRIISLIALLFVVFFLISYHSNISKPPSDPKSKNIYKLTTFNAYIYNNNHQKIIDFLKEKKSDVVVLEEVTEGLLEKLKSQKWNYSYMLMKKSVDNDYIVIMSRYPLIEIQAEQKFNSQIEYSLLRAACDFPDGLIRIYGIHLSNPVVPNDFYRRLEEYESLIKDIGKETNNLIVTGDFNTTPWSYYMQHFLVETGLHLYNRDIIYQPTWRRKIPFITIPIDHVLFGKNFELLSRTVNSDNVGSDHHPVTVQFTYVQKNKIFQH